MVSNFRGDAMKHYIGLSCSFHDPALAIVGPDGEALFAEGAERYLQNKRAFNAPPDDINRVDVLLAEYCAGGGDLVVSRTWSRGMARRLGLLRKTVGTAAWVTKRLSGGRSRNEEQPGMSGAMKAEHATFLLDVVGSSLSLASANLRLKVRLAEMFGEAPGGGGTREMPRRVQSVDFDHHLTHAATACYMSPYEEAVCAVVDGYGERGSTAFFHYRDGTIERIKAPPSKGRASLGRFYGFLTYACGFDVIKGEEWKVMGLAPYGSENPRVRDLVTGLLEVDGLRLVPGPNRRTYPELLVELRRYDPADVAFAGQLEFERVAAALLRNLHDLGLSDNLVLGGGCALNSSFNGKVLEVTPFRSLFVPCAPGDDGCALGAAWLAFRRDHPDAPVPSRFQSPYLGTPVAGAALARLKQMGRVSGGRVVGKEAAREAAALLAAGKIVGWVQGRAEFGPRALGNRSILADPRREDIKDELNRRVKFRESFRPFAPSILDEYGEEYFENYQASPYMERTLRFREEVRSRVPGVVHVNGTGRLQTVRREWNPGFYDLIEAFRKETGVPLVLNTSFNIMGKPILHSVEDAVGMFFTTGLDAVVVEDYLIVKE